jgi:tetratricopeptide (TPR) repeat protein
VGTSPDSTSAATSTDQASANLVATRAALYSEGNWEKALVVCNEVIEQSKSPLFGDYIVRYILQYGSQANTVCKIILSHVAYRANTYLKLNKFPAAIDDCSVALRMNPRSSAAYCTRAFAYRFVGKLAEAVGVLIFIVNHERRNYQI